MELRSGKLLDSDSMQLRSGRRLSDASPWSPADLDSLLRRAKPPKVTKQRSEATEPQQHERSEPRVAAATAARVPVKKSPCKTTCIREASTRGSEAHARHVEQRSAILRVSIGDRVRVALRRRCATCGWWRNCVEYFDTVVTKHASFGAVVRVARLQCKKYPWPPRSFEIADSRFAWQRPSAGVGVPCADPDLSESSERSFPLAASFASPL